MSGYILIIEDNSSMAGLEKRYLEKDGFKVDISGSGAEALALIKSKGNPDLMIVDYKLPDMSGVDLMSKLNESGNSIPTIIVTAAGNEMVAVSAMKLGAMDYIVKDPQTIKLLPTTCKEVIKKANLERENKKLIDELKVVNTELMDANQRLEELSKKDELTGIYNRRYLLESLSFESARSQRYHTPLSLAIFDVDHFKNINDTFGHITGDLVLKQFTTIIKSRLRKTDILGRYGGEEFGIALIETDLKSAFYLCDELRETVSHYTFGYEHSPICVNASAGVACLKDGMDVKALIEAADRGLYKAKNTGRNRVFTIQDELQNEK